MMLLMSRMVAEQRQAGFVDDDDDDEDEDEDEEDNWDTEDEDDEDTEDEDDDESFDGMYEPGMHPGTIREDELYADDLHRRYAGMDNDEDEDEDKDEDDQDDIDQDGDVDDDEDDDKDGDGDGEKVSLAGNVEIVAQGDRSRDLSLEVSANAEEKSI
jgi:hypothetical protein